MKTTVSAMKNALACINGRLDSAEEKNLKQKFNELWDNVKQPNIHLNGVLTGEKRMGGQKIFDKIMAEILLALQTLNPKIQELNENQA